MILNRLKYYSNGFMILLKLEFYSSNSVNELKQILVKYHELFAKLENQKPLEF